MPFPYARLIVGIRHCRVLISGNINSDATGIDMTVNSQQLTVSSYQLLVTKKE